MHVFFLTFYCELSTYYQRKTWKMEFELFRKSLMSARRNEETN